MAFENRKFEKMAIFWRYFGDILLQKIAKIWVLGENENHIFKKELENYQEK